ncbi:conserved protein, unknown function [Plasmodium gallinaceum]|uniref:DUF155 domain-containing protein n=1 Tax=Plasmodium gallinaceum TaxID=5849 RepID=A0A1J1GY61_PLAGA|nr:conserved protein, unknown function [Plasmodium gallinaceum]CRG97200.1 conserved protein, unknown function [Plasmodium gallinaceum]
MNKIKKDHNNKYLSDINLIKKNKITNNLDEEIFLLDESFIVNSSHNSIENPSRNLNVKKKSNIEKKIVSIQKKKKAYNFPYDNRASYEYHYKKDKKKKKKRKLKMLSSSDCKDKLYENKNSLRINMDEQIYKRKLKMYENNKAKVNGENKISENKHTVYFNGYKNLSNDDENYKWKKISFINKYIFERKEVNKINNNKIRENISYYNPDKLCLVKFLCQAKSYDLIKISKIFFSKKITYTFFDDNNVLCVFLTPESCIKNFYSSEDIYKIDNLDLKKNVTYPHTKFIFFIFKNGSVVIWENFKNYQNSDYFINKVIIFLNSFSDELLPVYIVQLDTIFYSEEEKYKEKREENENEKEEEEENEEEEEDYEDGEGEEKKKKKKNCFVNNGIIYLTNDSLEQKLTASFALSQSIRLDVHEMMMDIAINTLFNISKEIASKGTCIISKKKISSMLDVYSSIINVNAVQDFLDIPEYFWNKVQYEHLWFEIYKYMEIPERIKILNKRYNYYKDFLKVIKTEIYNKKTFYCYRIVVLLLFIHILALILNDLFFMK